MEENPFPTSNNELAIAEIWPNLCSSENRNLLSKVNNSLKVSGSYYAVTQDGGLIIIPNLGLAIITYFHG